MAFLTKLRLGRGKGEGAGGGKERGWLGYKSIKSRKGYPFLKGSDGAIDHQRAIRDFRAPS